MGEGVAGAGEVGVAISDGSGGCGRPSATPPVHLLQLPPTCRLVREGLPPVGPAITWSKELKDHFAPAHLMLSQVVDMNFVEFRDDNTWTVMPEIGQAIRSVGAEESCYCIAIAPDWSAWGVGIASGWKGRQPAAKLALMLALTRNARKLSEVAAAYPTFGAMLEASGLIPPR